MPRDLQKQVEKAEIDLAVLKSAKNFEVLTNALRFATKQHVKYVKHRNNAGQEEDVGEHSSESFDCSESTLKSKMKVEEAHAAPAVMIKAERQISVNPEGRKLFKNLEFSGKGGFGRVFYGTQTSDKTTVAVKKMTNETEKEILNNLSEIAYLKQCVHKNIVQYLSSYKVKNEIWLS